MSGDPAVEAAERAWFGRAPGILKIGYHMNNAAREALKPIRELHRPIEYYEYDDCNGVFKTDADGEQILMGRVCAECSTDEFLERIGDCEVEGSTHYEGEIDWPCATARLAYSAEELS